MKKSILFFIAIISIYNIINSQNIQGSNWVLGVNDQNHKGTILNFSNDTLKLYEIEKYMDMPGANVSISDIDGNLLFYSNGCYISNIENLKMLNGDSILYGVVQDIYCENGLSGSPFLQSQIIIPTPGNNETYYLIQYNNHQGIYITNTLGNILPTELTFSIIDMTEDNGLGAVVEKSTIILQDTLSGQYLQATKHSNGVDWWILVPEYLSNCYYKLLITSQGIQNKGKQCAGHIWNWLDIAGQATFSNNGEYYVRVHAHSGLNIFKFNRCTGLLSFIEEIPFLQDTGKIVGVSISPNSQYLYTFNKTKVYQFDLTNSNNIQSSQILVAEYDGFQNPQSTYFSYAQLAPDGKIYVSSSTSTYNLHVIEFPDKPGINCNVLQHEVDLFIPNYLSIPNIPNYALEASQNECDTTVVSNSTELNEHPFFLIYPNPASHYLNIQNSSNWDCNLVIYNFNNQVIYSADIKRQTSNYHIDIQRIPRGVYFYSVTCEEYLFECGKIIIN